MKHKQSILLLVLLLLAPLFFCSSMNLLEAAAQSTPPLYFGVDVAFGDIEQTKQLIDNVSAYTNFFIIGCSHDYNTTILSDISDYVYAKGLNFLVYTDDPRYPTHQWLHDANSKYGSQFMGIYFYDESGGKQLDQAKYPPVTSAANYSDAANQYVTIMNWWLGNNSIYSDHGLLSNDDYEYFTSDYALYWWDYQSGYNTIFAEFGERGGNWTYSRQLNVALCRGAASVFDKDWGVMITWSYIEPPYMESGTKLYNDMVLAYQNGAKYIVVFDSNEGWTENVLMQEHLDAMKDFWEFTQNNSRAGSPASERTAAVLPEDYAYGFRGPYDKVWGLWQADDFAVNISTNVLELLETYGGSLDLVYPSDQLEAVGYRNVIAWNNTAVSHTVTNLPTDADRFVFLAVGGSVVLIAGAITVVALKTKRKTATPNLT